MNRAADRIFGLFLLAIAAVFGGLGWGIQAPFSYDPLGPRPYPLLLAGVLAVLALWMIFKPHEVRLPARPVLTRGGMLIATLILYQLTFRWLGFIPSTILCVALLARMFRGSWRQGLVSGVGLALACFGLFNYVLEIPLPLGAIFSGQGG